MLVCLWEVCVRSLSRMFPCDELKYCELPKQQCKGRSFRALSIVELAQAAPEVIWCSYSPPKKAKTIKGAESTPGSGGGTAPSAEGGASTGGTVEGAGSEGKGEGPFKKGAQNGLFKCSQCGGYIHNASHKWMPHRDLDGRGPCWYYCHATETGAVKRSASWDSSFSLPPGPS